MKILVLVPVWTLLAVACGSHAPSNQDSRSDLSVAKTNVNAANPVPYSETANAYTFAQTDVEFAPLKEFVGKTASEMNLWQNRDVVARLRELMGADFGTMRKFWNTETPLKKFGDHLMLTGCEKNNCADNMYVVFMSTSEGLLKVVHVGRDTIREWSARRNIDLPPSFEEELATLRSNSK